MVETRMLVLLAPVYPDVCTTSGSTSVELQRTADDWLQLAFSTPNGIVTKEAACINNHDGCRCNYVRLLRSLMVLSEREALSITGTYLVAKTEAKAHAVLK
ncbi:hypothetical protein P3T76_000821 [Phytophthora citrophthora]|uniref:Uncharacterized protein n=1 Tax=Phytophthora citrophthora TaxID=4793 RepID=A0AAD9LVU9_9STRA|nr:hypothetical protein P3T76_000821 [Phytophthora citrophthora]